MDTNRRNNRWLRRGAVTALVVLALALPTAFSALSGSGNVEDIVQLDVTDGTLNTVQATASGGSPSASPVTSGSEAFTLTNSGSNVDTFIRFDWSSSPYYGSNTGDTSITIRGTTYVIGDLLWFKQQTLNSASTATTSEVFSPLVVKSGVSTSTFTADGDACTAWSTGTAAGDFSAAAGGSITFEYHSAASPVNDAPSTSDTFYYCLDTTSSQVYLGEAQNFDTATLVQIYSSDSAGGVLETYQYEFLSGSETEGNSYCLASITGSGAGATPDLVQCEKVPYETGGSTTAKLFALFDPPAYFPSVNQGGAITYSVAGTQWNPYASDVNSA